VRAESTVVKNASMVLPVSVQVCTLNEEANIRACLESVAANEPEEIVIIDGGSADNTIAIAREFGARVIAPGRLGLGPSRRLGYMSSESHYTAFVDADDRIPVGWLKTMIRELDAGSYAALQSSLRAVNEGSFWSRGWDQYFRESVRPTPDTTMVGRPALFLTSALQSHDAELTSLDEDTHLSRRFELAGLRQGIGSAIAYRRVEQKWGDNRRKWQSYGRGYRGFVDQHPERKRALMLHVAYTIPIRRSLRPLMEGHWAQPAFGALMALTIASGWIAHTASSETPRHS